MEIFIEGSRSRSGKPCTPKAGLLSVLVDCVKEGQHLPLPSSPLEGTVKMKRMPFCSTGVVDDILLVPVSISYDKVCVMTSCSVCDVIAVLSYWRGSLSATS